MRLCFAETILLLAPAATLHAADVPQSVAELWADFDPGADPLEVAVVREWKVDGGVYRLERHDPSPR